MRKAFKIATTIIVSPILVVVAYICFLWLTYISDPISSGEKYGFTIGATKEETYKDIASVYKQYPNIKIYIPFGPRVGDNMTISPTKNNFKQAKMHNHWELLLDGDDSYFNIIRLNHENNVLTKIYRHRQYFELP